MLEYRTNLSSQMINSCISQHYHRDDKLVPTREAFDVKKISKKSKVIASIISVLLIFSLLIGIGLAKGHSERDTNKTATASFEKAKDN